MLNVIAGPIRSGKTTKMLDLVAEDLKAGIPALVMCGERSPTDIQAALLRRGAPREGLRVVPTTIIPERLAEFMQGRRGGLWVDMGLSATQVGVLREFSHRRQDVKVTVVVQTSRMGSDAEIRTDSAAFGDNLILLPGAKPEETRAEPA